MSSRFRSICCCCEDHDELSAAAPSAENSSSSNEAGSAVRLDIISPAAQKKAPAQQPVVVKSQESVALLPPAAAAASVSSSAGSAAPASAAAASSSSSSSSSSALAGPVALSATPTADFPIGGRGFAPREVGLPPKQLERALVLSKWSSHDLGWRLLADPNPKGTSRHFYFNVWTGRTLWAPPAEVLEKRTLQNQQTDLLIPGSLKWVSGLVEWFAERDITLHLWDGSTVQRRERCAGHKIVGRPPCLLHLLFYAHVLANEFAVYPRSYLKAAGLRNIVLVDGLAYCGQVRAAIPLIETSTLMLDPKLEEIIYVTNVMHHELFHMVDCNMIWRASEQAQRRLSNSSAEDRTRTSMSALAKRNAKSDIEAGDRPFDFDTPQDPKAAAEPLDLYLLDLLTSLHSVPDVRWTNLNATGFRYGSGGASNREKHMFLSLGKENAPVDCGFLNAYCRTAVEEDKAEVYAAMIRNASALLLGDDPILRLKAKEMQLRLQWFCSDLNGDWWERMQYHTPHPQRPPNHVAASEWIERTDHDGNRYFFNRTTLQTSWIRPHKSQSPTSQLK